MDSSKRALVYMRQRNWPYRTGDPNQGGNLNMAWFGMTPRQRRRWEKKSNRKKYVLN
jgi:hypothetical protein